MTLFTHLFPVLAILYQTNAQKVALGTNTLAKNEKNIPLKADSFIDLISKGVFVDKTLFINAILSNSSGIPALAPPLCTYLPLIALTSPRKWGKTINLDMLKTFLQIPVHPNASKILPISSTPNYHLFTKGEYHSKDIHIELEKPMLISSPEYKPIIDEYLGQYPVIHLSFAGQPSRRGMSDLQILAEMISKAYQEHAYLVGVYNRTLQRPNRTQADTQAAEYCQWKYTAYLNRDISHEYDFENCLEFLAEELYDHFGVKAYVLIDDYTRFLGTNCSEIITLMLWNIIEDNDCVKEIILTGVLPTEIKSRPLHMELHYTPFLNYTGFTADEINLIYKFYQITEKDKTEVERWYGGYQTLEDPREKIFNPWSVCNYVTSRQLRAYWPDANYPDINLNRIFKSPQVKDTLNHLINGKVYNVDFKPPKFTLDELNSLNETIDKEMVLRYLFVSGFLTIENTFTDNSQQRSRIQGYKIPNQEIMNFLKSNFRPDTTSP